MLGWHRRARMVHLRRLLGNQRLGQLAVQLLLVVRLGMMLRQQVSGGNIPVISAWIMSKMFETCSGHVVRNHCGSRDGTGRRWLQIYQVRLNGTFLFNYCRSYGLRN